LLIAEVVCVLLAWLRVLDEIDDWLKPEPSETPLVVVEEAFPTSLVLF
jgi:hypothetical protein